METPQPSPEPHPNNPSEEELDVEEPVLDPLQEQQRRSVHRNPLGLTPEQLMERVYDANFMPRTDALKLSVQFIRLLREATLETSGMDAAAINKLRNPLTVPLVIENEDELYSLRQYIAASRGSQDIYRLFQANHNTRFPNHPMLSYEQVRKRLATWSGISPILTSQCPNTCMAFTGPFEDMETCLECGTSRWNPTILQNSNGNRKVPAREFLTIPLGPQLQALYRSPEVTNEMLYLQEKIKRIKEATGSRQGINIE
jgi:hypothetical protein